MTDGRTDRWTDGRTVLKRCMDASKNQFDLEGSCLDWNCHYASCQIFHLSFIPLSFVLSELSFDLAFNMTERETETEKKSHIQGDEKQVRLDNDASELTIYGGAWNVSSHFKLFSYASSQIFHLSFIRLSFVLSELSFDLAFNMICAPPPPPF